MATGPSVDEGVKPTSRRGYVRVFVVCTVMAVLFALSGAFGTDQIPIVRRIAYWLVLILSGTFLAFGIAGFLARRTPLGDHPVWLSAGIIVSVSLVQTPVVWLTHLVILNQAVTLNNMLAIGVATVCITSGLTLVAMMVRNDQPPVTHASLPDAEPPAFLARIPPKLRGGDLYAVEAQDHYLRLHTSKGQDLILMRLGDAVAELEGLEGAQTHRSWWVAREALVEAERGDGRATLTLKDGSQVPVSRAYAKALRQAGWF